MEESEQSEFAIGKSSKINSAMIVNMTLNELWKDSFKHFRSGKYLSWNNDLDTIWTILGGEPHIKGSSDETKFSEITKEITAIGNLTDGLECHGFDKVCDDYIYKLIKHKAILLKKALFLRRLQNSQGKGTAYNDEDDMM